MIFNFNNILAKINGNNNTDNSIKAKQIYLNKEDKILNKIEALNFKEEKNRNILKKCKDCKKIREEKVAIYFEKDYEKISKDLKELNDLQKQSYSQENLKKSNFIINYSKPISLKKMEKYNIESFINSMIFYKENSDKLNTMENWVSCKKHEKNLSNLKSCINTIKTLEKINN